MKRKSPIVVFLILVMLTVQVPGVQPAPLCAFFESVCLPSLPLPHTSPSDIDT